MANIFTNVKAAIFDLDGVLVDTAKYHYLAWRRLANELGFDLSEAENEKLKGVSRIDSLNLILALGNQSCTENEKLALAEKKNTWFVEYLNQMQPSDILPGASTLLETLRSQGIKIALGSSSKNAKTVLQLLSIEHLFDVVIDGTMVTNSKPHPEVFLLGASRLSIDPEYCVVFEDAEAGVDAALSAGMRCVGVGQPHTLQKAHLVVPNLLDFSFETNLVS